MDADLDFHLRNLAVFPGRRPADLLDHDDDHALGRQNLTLFRRPGLDDLASGLRTYTVV